MPLRLLIHLDYLFCALLIYRQGSIIILLGVSLHFSLSFLFGFLNLSNLI